MIRPQAKKKEEINLLVPIGFGILFVMIVLGIVLTALTWRQSGLIREQQVVIVELLKQVNEKQNQFDALTVSLPHNSASTELANGDYTSQQDFEKFRREYVKEIRRMKKLIQNLKAYHR